MVRREYNEGGKFQYVFESTSSLAMVLPLVPPLIRGDQGEVTGKAADPQRSPEHALVCNGRQPMHVCACCANLLKIKADFTPFLPAQLLGCAILHIWLGDLLVILRWFAMSCSYLGSFGLSGMNFVD